MLDFSIPVFRLRTGVPHWCYVCQQNYFSHGSPKNALLISGYRSSKLSLFDMLQVGFGSISPSTGYLNKKVCTWFRALFLEMEHGMVSLHQTPSIFSWSQIKDMGTMRHLLKPQALDRRRRQFLAWPAWVETSLHLKITDHFFSGASFYWLQWSGCSMRHLHQTNFLYISLSHDM